MVKVLNGGSSAINLPRVASARVIRLSLSDLTRPTLTTIRGIRLGGGEAAETEELDVEILSRRLKKLLCYC
jgi:hypothetical protein